MKLVKNFLFAMLLVSAMAVTTPAGDQNTPGYTCTPTPTTSCPNQVVSDPDTSDTEETAGIIAPETTDYLLCAALTAFLSVY